MRDLLIKKGFPIDLFFTQNIGVMETERHLVFLYEAIMQHSFKDGSAREIHDMLHSTRVSLLTSVFDDLFTRYVFPTSLSDEDRQLLFISALWHDAGREADGEDFWDKDSAELLYYYLTVTVKIDSQKAILFAETIANKDYVPGKTTYHSMVIADDRITWENQITPNQKTIFQNELHDSDSLDIARIKINDFDPAYLDFYKKVEVFNGEARKELAKLIAEQQYLIETHSKNRDKFNNKNCFDLTLKLIQSDPGFSYLKKYYSAQKRWLEKFTSYTKNDDALKNELISLSKKIQTEAQFKWLCIFLNRYHIEGHEAVVAFLNRIQTSKTPLDEVIKQEEEALDKIDGRLFKVVPNTKDCYWPDIVKALKNLAGYRPELKQFPTRKPYTSRLWNGNYVQLPTNKAEKKEAIKMLPPQTTKEDKYDFTRPQSLSYCNPTIGYHPKPYPGRGVSENDPVVAISFSAASCSTPRRIMIFNIRISTYGRTYDAPTPEAARDFVNKNLQRGEYFNTYADQQKYALFHDNIATTEVIAGYNMNPSLEVTICKKNHLESNLLAQLRALDLQLAFPYNPPINISVYPDFHLYTLSQQAEDKNAAKAEKLEHYLHALSFLSGNHIIDTHESIIVLRKTAELLERNTPEIAIEFNRILDTFTHTLSKKFCALSASDFAWVKKDKFDVLRNTAQNNTATTTQLSQIQFLIRLANLKENETPWDHILFLDDIDNLFELSENTIDCSNSHIRILDDIQSLSELKTALLQIPIEKEKLISTIIQNKQALFQTSSEVFELAKTLASRKTTFISYSKNNYNTDQYKFEFELICKNFNLINMRRLLKTTVCFYEFYTFLKAAKEAKKIFSEHSTIHYIVSHFIRDNSDFEKIIPEFIFCSPEFKNNLINELCRQEKMTKFYLGKTADDVINTLKEKYDFDFLTLETQNNIQKAFENNLPMNFSRQT